jgi:hypothetical protein
MMMELRQSWAPMKQRTLRSGFCACLLLAASLSSLAQSLDEQILGEWKMELRILDFPGVKYHQEEASIFISEKNPDGTFRIISHITTRAVADSEYLLVRPECEGKTECIYDDGSEGIGRLINGKLFIDWISEGWIDDVFTISGNKMTGDDGNGPIRLTKAE